jgi:uncharacterized protein YfiM (DUF2279 family)
MTWKRPLGCPVIAIVALFQVSISFSQSPVPGLIPSEVTTLNENDRDMVRCRRRNSLIAGGLMLGTYVALDRVWYADYERSSMHSFDDSGEWMQMDKAGHFFSAYTLGRWGHAAWAHCGTSETEAILVGGSMGLIFLTGVELLDGTSAGWGFSWSDMAANALGTGLFMGQQAGWHEQRVFAKFSAHLTPYASENPELLGEGLGERILKDYNGQTIWLSANLWTFKKVSRIPKWLCLSGGYGAEGMVSAYPQDDPDVNGGYTPYRQYFLAPDVDLTRIPTRSKVLRTVLFVLNGVKIPMPTLEFRSDGRVLAHGLYF